MANEETLRALLAEARAAVHLVLDIDALQGWACEAVDDAPPVDDVLRILRDRIDAALAEPVEGPLNAISRLQQQLHEAKSNADWLVQQAQRERDEARAELDFIKAEYGDADDDSLTRDALLLKLRLLASEMDGERASRRAYERAHDDILAALKRAEADAYHPEDGEPVALWGVERLAKQRDEARAEVKELREVLATAGSRLRACGEQLTEHAYQEMASVLFDLPQATDGTP